jgi:hypothetical protein
MEKLLSITINTQSFETIRKNQGTNKSKTYRSFKSQIQHNTRKESMDENYLIRPNETKNNIHIELDDLDNNVNNLINKMNEDYKEYYKRKIPKNTKNFINGLITFSDSMQEDIKKFGIDVMFNTVKNYLQEEFDNVITLDLHLDETTPHFHFQVLNYDFKNHKTFSRKLEESLRDKNNIERRNYLQDNLQNYLQDNISNFDYSRGKILGIKNYHNKRKNQVEHIKKLEHQEQKYLQELEQLKEENLYQKKIMQELQSDKKRLQKELNEYEELREESIKELQSIMSDFVELGLTYKNKSSIALLKLFDRYYKSKNPEKFNKLFKTIKDKIDNQISKNKSSKNIYNLK